MKRLLAWIAVIVLLITMATFSNSVYSSERGREFVIYIDPSFGGSEDGPLILKKYKSKNITLSFAEELKKALELQGVAVIISRNKDATFSLKERVALAKNNSVDLYLNIRVSEGNRKCIRVYFPKGASKTSADDSSYESIVQNLTAEARVVDSMHSALSITNCLKQSIPSFCIDSQAGESALFKNTDMPNIIFDLSIARSDTKPYVLEQVFIEKIANAASHGIVNYIKEQKNSWRQKLPSS